MEFIDRLIRARVPRLNLDPTKSYYRVQRDKEPKYVGRFVRAYRMGSGDGMTAHWEFDNNGTITTEDDDMWGSLSGAELVYFVVADAYNKVLDGLDPTGPDGSDGPVNADPSDPGPTG
jgi:hypothetical protein